LRTLVAGQAVSKKNVPWAAPGPLVCQPSPTSAGGRTPFPHHPAVQVAGVPVRADGRTTTDGGAARASGRRSCRARCPASAVNSQTMMSSGLSLAPEDQTEHLRAQPAHSPDSRGPRGCARARLLHPRPEFRPLPDLARRRRPARCPRTAARRPRSSASGGARLLISARRRCQATSPHLPNVILDANGSR
jgi:hypothetical protein